MIFISSDINFIRDDFHDRSCKNFQKVPVFISVAFGVVKRYKSTMVDHNFLCQLQACRHARHSPRRSIRQALGMAGATRRLLLWTAASLSASWRTDVWDSTISKSIQSTY